MPTHHQSLHPENKRLAIFHLKVQDEGTISLGKFGAKSEAGR